MKKLYLINSNLEHQYYYCPDVIKFFKIKPCEKEQLNEYIKNLNDTTENINIEYDNNILKQLTIDVVDGCNLKCKYCYAQAGTYGKKFKITTLDQMINAYEKICAKYTKGIETICFFGGEPMLGFLTIRKFVNYVNEYTSTHNVFKTKFSMITNATLITSDDWDFLVKNNFILTISLDGNKQINDEMRIFKNEKGSVFDKVSTLMLNKKDSNIFVFAEATLTPSFFKQYEGEINEYNEVFIKLGFDGFFPFAADGQNQNYDDKTISKMKEFYTDFCNYWLNELINVQSSKYNKTPFLLVSLIHLLTSGERNTLCGAGRNTIFLGTDSNFYKCQMYYKNNDYITLDDLNFKAAYKPKLIECEDCISKYTCSFWCEGGAKEFGNGTKVPEIRCIIQNVMTLSICKWLVNLSSDQIDLVCERLQKMNYKSGDCI